MIDKNSVLMLLSLAALVSAVFPAVAQPARPADSWLDQELTPWNRLAGALPQLPSSAAEDESSNKTRCAEHVRPPANAAERALVRRGWTLYGATQSYGQTQVITALSDFDGMCRPLGFQAFVYWEGRYAGTLSPVLMNSRTDAALTDIHLVSETRLAAEFARYTDADPLCCPSRSSTVSYTLRRDDTPDLVPTQVTTVATRQTGEQATADHAVETLFGKRWVLSEIGERRLSAATPYIEFARDSRRVSGDSGCNRFSGTFELNGTALKLSRLASTRRACLSEEANRLEAEFLRLLEATTRFEAQSDRLRLYANDQQVLVFIKAE